MNIKDYFKTAYLFLKRDKRKLSYIVITFICSVLSLIIFSFYININNIISITLKRDIGYREINVGLRENLNNEEEQDMEKILNEDIREIRKISSVIDVYQSNYFRTVLKSNITNSNLDGTVTLLRATPSSLPIITSGRAFNEAETGVAICPEIFYPNFDPEKINSENAINGKNLLDKTFTVTYYDYIREDNYGTPKENNNYTKEFKIIGLYNNSDRLNDNGTCYIAHDDMVSIIDTMSSWNTFKSYGLSIIVDDVKNVDAVYATLKDIGFFQINLSAHLDYQVINTLKISIALLFSLILTAIIVLTSLFVKKRISYDEQIIGLMKSVGYNNKKINIIYILEIIILNTLITVLSSSIFTLLFYFIVNNINIFKSASMIYGNFLLNYIPYILTIVIIIIIPGVISFILTNRISDKPAIILLKREN